MSTSPLRCAVLVPDIDPKANAANVNAPPLPGWRVLWANGDEAEARKIAAEWVRENPGQEAHLFIRDDTARAVTRIEWTKP